LLADGSSWWVSSLAMLPLVILLGLLVIRKLRRFHLFFSFLLTGLATAVIFSEVSGFLQDKSLADFIGQWLLSWPVFFFGAFMLTEPQTTPPTKLRRIIYGGLVGVLFGAPIHIGNFYLTTELALMLGNIFAFSVGFKDGIVLRFREKRQLGRNIFEFIFMPNKPINFIPGQYFEWTLAHKNPDNRGIRRYFTICSSPTEGGIRLATKFFDKGSSFKKALLELRAGDRVSAHGLDGDFILPADTREKLAFIAGGIGITPFRSMIKFLVDSRRKMDIVLFYACSDSEEFVYKDLLKEAEALGLKTVFVLSQTPAPSDWFGRTGFIGEQLIKEEASDFSERIFYLSGPERMVENYEKLLLSMGLPQPKIKADYFPGY